MNYKAREFWKELGGYLTSPQIEDEIIVVFSDRELYDSVTAPWDEQDTIKYAPFGPPPKYPSYFFVGKNVSLTLMEGYPTGDKSWKIFE